jgi:hypothetical protein
MFEKCEFEKVMFDFSPHATRIIAEFEKIGSIYTKYEVFQTDIIHLAINSGSDTARHHYLKWYVAMSLYVLDHLKLSQSTNCNNNESNNSNLNNNSDFWRRLNDLISQLRKFESINCDSIETCKEYTPLLDSIAKQFKIITNNIQELRKNVTGSLVSCPLLIVHTLAGDHEVVETFENGRPGITIVRCDVDELIKTSPHSCAKILNATFLIPSPSESFINLTQQLMLTRINIQETQLRESHCKVILNYEQELDHITKTRTALLEQQEVSGTTLSAVSILSEGAIKFSKPIEILKEDISIFQRCSDSIAPQSEDNCISTDENDSVANNHGFNDWTAVDTWHEKGRIASQLFDTFTSRWAYVYNLYMSTDYPEELPPDELELYEKEVAWYRDHLKYQRSHIDFQPYKVATRDSDPILCHPLLGPWTGPYRELTDSGVNSQYGILYDKKIEHFDFLMAEKKRSMRSSSSGIKRKIKTEDTADEEDPMKPKVNTFEGVLVVFNNDLK